MGGIPVPRVAHLPLTPGCAVLGVACLIGLGPPPTPVAAQESLPPDTVTEVIDWRRSILVPIPVLYYTPETRWAWGAAGLHTYRSSPHGRPTVSGGSAVYTQNRQAAVELRTEAYLADGDYVVNAEAAYARYPDVFFGIGNATLEADEEAYTGRGFRLGLDVRRRIRPGMYVGGTVEVRNETVVEPTDGGLLATGVVPGAGGGLAWGTGLVLARDTRDNMMNPSGGSMHTLSVARLGHPFGGDFDLTRVRLDLRRYATLAPGQGVGVQAVAASTFGDVPFHLMPRLGGSGILRGILEGRYRDRHLLAAQAEYRLHVWRRFGIVAFAGAGQVARRLEQASLRGLHYSVGSGLRFRLDPREGTCLRLDFGYAGSGRSGVYITIGEAF